MRHLATAFLMISITAAAVFGQNRRPDRRTYPPELPGAQVETYKTIGDVTLNLYIFTPPHHQPTDKSPAIVFFFGGGWTNGSPTQFLNQCRYLASRGMVAISADYRVRSRQGTPAVKCVEDAKSAIRWVRANATRLGVDPDRIAAGGGSAGGHIAACTGTIDGLDAPGEDTSISSKPNAMVLFNPALVLAPVEDRQPFDSERMANMRERAGIDPAAISPVHHVAKGVPPTIILHGTSDTTVPFWTVELFAKKMKEAGNTCRLVPAEGQAHGFFNYGRGDNSQFVETMRAADEFLAEQGFLKGKPTIDQFE